LFAKKVTASKKVKNSAMGTDMNIPISPKSCGNVKRNRRGSNRLRDRAIDADCSGLWQAVK
jgi:hypothetical protein